MALHSQLWTRQQCADCGAHTFNVACVVCGSGRLTAVALTRGNANRSASPARMSLREPARTPTVRLPHAAA